MLIRVSVVLGRGKNGVPLMPTRLTKANRLVSEGKAKWVYSKSLRLRYLRLLEKPIELKLQSVNLGFDPGSCFDGISVNSSKYNHLNIELLHNKGVKDRVSSRRSNRKLRRGRLRQRPARFDSRNSSKMVPTIRSMLEFRKFIVSEVLKVLPISKVIFERVTYSGKNQKSFTQVHLGQQSFINFLKTKVNRVIQVKGYFTKAKRIKLFGGKNKVDLKLANKGARSFYAHCLDSFSLASIGLPNFKLPRIALTRFISKNLLIRRELFKDKKLQKDKKEYFKYVPKGTIGSEFMKAYWVKREFCKGSKVKGYLVKAGFVKYFTKLGKPSVCYSQLYPNSFSRFQLNLNGRAECFKHAQPSNHGGTIAKGQSRYSGSRGVSKRCIFKNNVLVAYWNRSVSFSFS